MADAIAFELPGSRAQSREIFACTYVWNDGVGERVAEGPLVSAEGDKARSRDSIYSGEAVNSCVRSSFVILLIPDGFDSGEVRSGVGVRRLRLYRFAITSNSDSMLAISIFKFNSNTEMKVCLALPKSLKG
jgi:hypothetical protein